ncbi:MAG: CHAP domain-containing protein [Solirubrobacterales bacterium]|nr:CHAP domain-containing protein [Solirubrobacterales bacterium]
MSIETTLLRIGELQRAFRPPAPANTGPPGTFATALSQAQAAPPAGGGGGTLVGLAQAEVGQAESPPGSNDSARIAQYRSAVPGGPVGPWCAYFASWVARESGTPLGDRGQGFARVDDVWAWAQRSGRAVPSGTGAPQPGDLVIWDEHMGIVESVMPDGSIQTIEGNSSDQVSRRSHKAGPPIVGYVRVA